MMSQSNRPTLYLIDGPNLAFRAFFAITGMTNSSGMPTNALYGFTNMLVKLIRDEKPDYLAIAWDPKGGSFRNRDYPEYKGTRPDMPAGLRQQMPHFTRIADAFGIPFICIEDFEADDVMGTLADRHGGELDVVLVTSDKDMMQLVTEHTSLLDTMKNKRSSFDEVREKFGCDPSLVPDALGIWGDSSDNIPGVKGIGEKGAKTLLGNWKGLDEIYANIDEIGPPKTREKLINDRDNAFLSRDLATIRRDAPVEIELSELTLNFPPPVDKARELFTELEFRGMLKELGGEMNTIDRSHYRLITSIDELKVMVAKLRTAGRFALDTETTSLDALTTKLVGLSFCSDDQIASYIPVGHVMLFEGESQLSWPSVRDEIKDLLEDPAMLKTGQNLKFDLKVLAGHGIELAGIAGDTLLADYLLSPDRRSHKLDDLALVHLEHRMIPFSETVPKGETFAVVPLKQARDYAAEDAHITWLLDKKLNVILSETGLDSLYNSLEIPLLPVLARMERHGIKIDRESLSALSVELGERIEVAQRLCHELGGSIFNINSVKQLRFVLFEHLGLPVIRSTKTGPSTNEAVLTELAESHELPRAILEYRSLVKLKNTYVDPLPEIADASDRVHTNFSQATAATGRLSSTEPNLQNIPVRTPDGRRIRSAFIAEPGRFLLAADYSQIELRILAHLVGGTGGFADAFAAGKDIHKETAASLFGIDTDEVTREMRSMAKAVNFGIVYGQSAFGLAQSQGISRTEAADYIKRYKERFPEIEEYRLAVLEQAKERGFVETILGRRRPVPDLNAGNVAQRNQAERIAVNTPVQGSAADLIKLAMIAVDENLTRHFPGQLLLLQVHDELLLEVDEDQVEAISAMVREEMVSAIELKVPLIVDIGVGKNWNEAH